MRDGIIPMTLGTVITAGATAVRARDIQKRGMRQKDVSSRIETAILGFGLAHIILGTIDIMQDN